ncbi:hypothetical protein BC937DRAFT_89687 [Endogone sp. FLAS-F59071]|nr:hypothetical protein BC937DRAFT_89687 [Endogone sp. FLAS-F59071]|eukprot:RUS17645.1 hypothetical protein BC937DRAFT_89687 [Endogone sp. FLAS-F59071]
MQQVQRLFNEFARKELITIDQNIVNEIHLLSNGHPGMVCLYGRAIAENLSSIIDYRTSNVDYEA